MKYGFLGPLGTFSHSAAAYFAGSEQLVPYPSIYKALSAVNDGEADFAVVPVENSTEGSVNATIDALIFDFSLFIDAQLNMPIEEGLFAKTKLELSEIKKVLSHPQALAQCAVFIRENLPEAEVISVASTSEAMRVVANSDEPIAAIGNKFSAPLYGLETLRERIQDSNKNFTRFALVRKDAPKEAGERTKTTVSFSVSNEPGCLFKILSIFSIYDVNMTKLISRPMRDKPEEYVFFVDLENDDLKDIADALTMVKRKTSFYKLLGSYNIYDLR